MINMRFISRVFVLFLSLFFLISSHITKIHAAGHPEKGRPVSGYQKLRQAAEEGIRGPIAGSRVYWKDGLRFEGPYKKLKLKIGGRIHVDGGYIDSDRLLRTAFPDFEGGSVDLRRLFLDVSGTLFDFIEFKTQIDFSDARSIKDNWIGLRGIPALGHIRVGHMKEPFSLEELTSSNHSPLMEQALPTAAIAPGSNVGIRCHNAILNGRMTWAAGAFLDVGSFSEAGHAEERIENSRGLNVTGRMTGLPWYADKGSRLLHLGVSYGHQFRDEERIESRKKLSTRPESHLTDVRPVSTGLFSTHGLDLINPELAVVYGPFSFQGEYFHVLANGPENLNFWGFYVYASWCITGENRRYSISNGTFSGIKPNNNFNPFKGGWGALEAAFRYSHLDLNDQHVRGGKERNFTVGLNWYPYPKVRFMFNYIHIKVMDRDRPFVDDGRGNIFMTRLQFHF
jgi:phosphate-selective porin OprO/OprP